MTSTIDPFDPASERAARELTRLNDQVQAMRAVLIRLLQDVVVAERRLSGSEAAQLLEANEQLVVAAVQHQAAADTAAQALSEVSRTAELDALTKLPNRVLLLDRFASAIANARRHGTRLGVLFLDIDDFKGINDSSGHAIGDEALRRVADCLSSAVRAGDTVSRHGGDEFLVLLTEVSQAADALRVADKVMALLRAAAPVGGQSIRLTASIGISLYPDHSEDAATLIKLADAAMYVAKRRGTGRCVMHGQAPLDEPRPHPPARDSPRRLETGSAVPDVESESLHSQLREANERLLLAALDAQALQAAAEGAHQRQTDFLTLVAHELSHPMAPIRIAAAQLGGAQTEELLHSALGMIERQMALMSRRVDDLLDAARGHEVPR